MAQLDYIHFNPVRSGIVARTSDYLYSSAANYVQGDGVLEDVTLSDNPVAVVLGSWSIVKYENY